MSAIWNLRELDVHMQPELLSANIGYVFGVARPKETKIRLLRSHASPLSAHSRCQMSAIWNLKELDVHMQPELLFANVNDVLGVARPNGTRTRLCRCHTSPLSYPPRCQRSAIWNLKELDVHMQPELLFANVNDVLGVARPNGTRTRLCRCHTSPLSYPPRCQRSAIWNLKELDVHMPPGLLFANVNDVFGVTRPKGTENTSIAHQVPRGSRLLPPDNEEVLIAGWYKRRTPV